MVYEDSKAYSRNYALGMNYLNQFLIEEESQFECDGVLGEDTSLKKYNRMVDRIYDHEFDQNFQMHLIVASHRHIPILKSFYEVQKANLMVTCIGSERLECVNGDVYDKLHLEGGFIRYKQQSRFRSVEVESSIGDDIEIFVELVKSGKYTQDFDNNTFFKYFPRHISPEWFRNAVTTFDLRLLKEWLWKFRARSFKHNTKIIDFENNYALSICYRKTSFQLQGKYKEIFRNYAAEQMFQANTDELNEFESSDLDTDSEPRKPTTSDTDSDTPSEETTSSDSGCSSDNSDPEEV